MTTTPTVSWEDTFLEADISNAETKFLINFIRTKKAEWEAAARQEGWEQEFDKEYEGTDGAVGIIAEAMTHARTKPFGTDASYITTKLRKLLAAARADERARLKEVVEKADIAEDKVGTFQDGYRCLKAQVLHALAQEKEVT